MSEFCKVEREGRVLTVTLDRPEVLNALHPSANAELAGVFDEFDADPDLWVAIVTGSGDRAFCTGIDLKNLAGSEGPLVGPATGIAGLTSRHHSMKPILAAVNGLALGGGFEVALACDLVVAAERAEFGLPEPRVGLAALGGGMHRLPRQIGKKQAMGMLLTGRRVTAAEGLALGFVNEVVPGPELMACAHRWVDQIFACAPLSVRASKQCAREGMRYGSVEEAMAARYAALDAMMGSDDFREGPRAFAEKRPARWKGR